MLNLNNSQGSPVVWDFVNALRLARKANFFGLSAGVLLVVMLTTVLSAYFGGRQPATVALDVGFSTIRLLLPLLIVLLVQELLSCEFDKRYYLNSLTYPRGRNYLLLGRFIAVLVVVLSLLLVLGLLQAFLVAFIGDIYPQATSVALGQPYFIVLAFIALDLLVLVAMATFLAVVASTPSFVLIGTFGFMMVARSYSAIIALLSSDAGVVANAEGYRSSLGVLAFILPDLGALDVRMFALYGKTEFLPTDWPWLLVSNLGYTLVLLALAIWALQHKRLA